MLLFNFVNAMDIANNHGITNTTQLMTFMCAMDAYEKKKRYTSTRLSHTFNECDTKFQVSKQGLSVKGLFCRATPTEKGLNLHRLLKTEGFSAERSIGLYRICEKLQRKLLLDLGFFALILDMEQNNKASFVSMRRFFRSFFSDRAWRTRTKDVNTLKEKEGRLWDRADLHPGADYLLLPLGRSYAYMLLHTVCNTEPKRKRFTSNDLIPEHQALVANKRKRKIS